MGKAAATRAHGRRMHIVFSGIIPALGKSKIECEDRGFRSPPNETIAICDGASESFDSAGWARFVSVAVCRSGRWDVSFLQTLPSLYGQHESNESDRWYEKKAIERGSFTTLLAVRQHVASGVLRLLWIGDSAAFLFANRTLVARFPQQQESSMSPHLVSTVPERNAFITSDFVASHTKTIHVGRLRNAVLLLVTDALASWISSAVSHGTSHGLPDDPNEIDRLCSVRTSEEYKEFVSCERESGRLKNDDTTLVVMR